MPTAISSLAVATPRVRLAKASPVLLLFGSTLFLSALLLFGVQPMLAKMALPVLGGTPAVWSVAMVFFQGLLLAGYLYAHALTRFLGLRTAVCVHLCVLAIAFVALPIAIAPGWGRPPAEGEALWLLGLFGASVGLPFFAVAANGPLLQAWFARSGDPQAQDPYFLYAASNWGSFAALAAYPVLVEPVLALREQSAAWSIGFGLLAATIAACGLAAMRGRALTFEAAPAAAPEAAVGWRDRLAWLGLSFVPSGLLVSVTSHLSTDVAAAPLLWVVPLALFLLSFVLAFRERPVLAEGLLVRLQVWGTAIALGFLALGAALGLALSLAVHLALFLVSATLCHTALYHRRPGASRLTEFYLVMSLGGVLGGVFCGLLAPRLFSSVLEYPLLLAAALACRPGFFAAIDRRKALGGVLTSAVVLGVAAAVPGLLGIAYPELMISILVGTLAFLTLTWRVPTFVAPAAFAALGALAIHDGQSAPERVRSFFGVHKISVSDDGRFVHLEHGTTLHGAMRLKNDDGSKATGRPEPTTYYTFEGGLGQAVAAMRAARGGLGTVAAVGLGSGSLACHASSGESWRFFEIDPDVVRIAGGGSAFRFLRDCAPEAPVILGDARLTLADERQRFGLIVLDAFSSDAIPTHLLTREAIGLYLDRLEANGALVFHISNRHLDLRKTLARTGAEHGLVAFHLADTSDEPFARRMRASSHVMALARDPSHLGALAQPGSAWRAVPVEPDRRPWTDDYSNILSPLLDAAARERR